jgi:hypothetical protein
MKNFLLRNYCNSEELENLFGKLIWREKTIFFNTGKRILTFSKLFGTKITAKINFSQIIENFR